MVATVIVKEITGDAASQVYTTKTTDTDYTSRYYTADDPSATSTANPVPIPNVVNDGFSGSYWKTHCLHVSVAPSVRIENIRYYVGWTTHPSSQWTLCANNSLGDHIIGVSSATLSLARTDSQGFWSGSYDQANGVETEFGYFISGNTVGGNDHTYYAACTNGHYESTYNFNTQSDAIMVYSGQWSGGSPTPARTGYTPCICTQVIVASGATQGSKTPVTATWVYDEV